MKILYITFLWFAVIQSSNGLSKLCSALEGQAVEITIEENDDARVYHLLFANEFKDHKLVDVSIDHGDTGSVLVETHLYGADDEKSYASFVGFRGHGEIYVLANFGLGACTRQNATLIEPWKEKSNDT